MLYVIYYILYIMYYISYIIYYIYIVLYIYCLLYILYYIYILYILYICPLPFGNLLHFAMEALAHLLRWIFEPFLENGFYVGTLW